MVLKNVVYLVFSISSNIFTRLKSAETENMLNWHQSISCVVLTTIFALYKLFSNIIVTGFCTAVMSNDVMKDLRG